MFTKNWKFTTSILLAAMLLITFGSVSGWMEEEEPTKYTLTITDGDLKVLDWAETVAVFPFNPESKKQGNKPIAEIESPSDPVKVSLPKGEYNVVISILGFRVESKKEELFLIRFEPINLSQKLTFDLRKASVSTGNVPQFIPSELMSDKEKQQEY